MMKAFHFERLTEAPGHQARILREAPSELTATMNPSERQDADRSPGVLGSGRDGWLVRSRFPLPLTTGSNGVKDSAPG